MTQSDALKGNVPALAESMANAFLDSIRGRTWTLADSIRLTADFMDAIKIGAEGHKRGLIP